MILEGVSNYILGMSVLCSGSSHNLFDLSPIITNQEHFWKFLASRKLIEHTKEELTEA